MNTTLLAGLAMAVASFIALPASAFAATYYVSNDGDNQNDGRTPDTALSALAEAAGRVQRGDRILLRRGDVLRESVEITVPDIEIDAFAAR